MRHRLTVLGGFDAKGPACFLLEIGSAWLPLDLGKVQAGLPGHGLTAKGR